MAKLGLTYDRVATVAETLIERGENPTIMRIRQALGDTGSNSTISKYLNEWRGVRSQSTHTNTVSMSDPVNDAVNRVWHQLREESQAEIAKMKDEAHQAVEEANYQKDNMELERNRAFAELESLQSSVSTLKTENMSLASDLNKLQNQHDVVLGRLEAVEKHYNEFKSDKEKQILEMINFKDQSIQNLKEQMQFLIQQHKKEIDDLRQNFEDQRHQWITKNDTVKTDNARLENKLNKMEGIEQQSLVMMVELRQQVKTKDIQLENIQERQKSLTETLLEREVKIASLKSKLEENRLLAEVRHRHENELEITLRQERENIGKLEERLRYFTIEIEKIKSIENISIKTLAEI